MDSNPKTKKMTHFFNLPPTTDVDALSRSIGLLIQASTQVPNELANQFQPLDCTEHPIPEVRAQLLSEFAKLATYLVSLKTNYEISLSSALVNGPIMVLTFDCTELPPYVNLN